MKRFFIQLYLTSLTPAQVAELARNAQIPFTNEEIQAVLPVLQRDWELYFTDFDELYRRVLNVSSADCAQRTLKLFTYQFTTE